MTFTKDTIIGFAVIIIVVLGVLWYENEHANTAQNQTATSTAVATTPTSSGPTHITESGQYYSVDAAYPSATALLALPSSADVDAVALMKQWELDSVAQFKTDTNADNPSAQDLQILNAEAGRKYSLTIQYQTYTSPHTVTYVYQIFEDTLGAHPNTTYKTFTFNNTNGQELSLGDLFTGNDYATTLSQLARAKLPTQIASAEQVDVSQVDTDMLDQGTSADPNNFADFYFDGSNFSILFPPYAVGPYVLGLVTLTVPASDVSGLKPNYP